VELPCPENQDREQNLLGSAGTEEFTQDELRLLAITEVRDADVLASPVGGGTPRGAASDVRRVVRSQSAVWRQTVKVDGFRVADHGGSETGSGSSTSPAPGVHARDHVPEPTSELERRREENPRYSF